MKSYNTLCTGRFVYLCGHHIYQVQLDGNLEKSTNEKRKDKEKNLQATLKYRLNVGNLCDVNLLFQFHSQVVNELQPEQSACKSSKKL